MKSATKTSAPSTAKKRRTKALADAALATCPVGGAGWCPYPFSPAQLQKRLQAKLNEQANAEDAQGKNSGKRVVTRKARRRA